MSLQVLDTDTLSLFARGHPQVVSAVNALRQDDIAVTVISVEEQILGWHDLARRARDHRQLAHAYGRMAETVERLSGIRVLPFDETAIEQFERFKAMRLGVGTMDLRIAAIALTIGAVVVTRNVRDFGRVPDLVIADWTQSAPPP